MMNKNWNENHLLGVNSIVRNNGEVTILNCFKNEEGKPFCFPFCDTTLTSLLKYDEDILTEVQVFARCEDSENGIQVSVGEGGMGNEGFIVCTDHQQSFKWGIFFENSNPFDKVELKENKILAYSTSGFKYIVDLDSPEFIDIISFDNVDE